MAPNKQAQEFRAITVSALTTSRHRTFCRQARRFCELRGALVAAEERSEAEHPHEYFVSCDLCDRASQQKTSTSVLPISSRISGR
jgi:hypothetical protein